VDQSSDCRTSHCYHPVLLVVLRPNFRLRAASNMVENSPGMLPASAVDSEMEETTARSGGPRDAWLVAAYRNLPDGTQSPRGEIYLPRLNQASKSPRFETLDCLACSSGVSASQPDWGDHSTAPPGAANWAQFRKLPSFLCVHARGCDQPQSSNQSHDISQGATPTCALYQQPQPCALLLGPTPR
jgi:hypothetical protein